MFYVYILRSKRDSKRYIGFTSNLELRVKQHNEGLVVSTKNRRPLELIHYETFEIKKDAEERERFYKTGKGREFLKNLEL